MFSTTFAVIALASMTSFIAEAGSQEIYLYTIYYDQTSCGKTAVSLVGHSSNDDEYSVSATDNTTELCSVESTCLMNNNSDICQSLGPSSPVWGRADINPDGNIFECDDSNSVIDQAVCRVLDQCHQSSKYPHCSFSLATTSTLFENLDLVRNDDAFRDEGLSHQSYMLLYSDDECSEFEGARGVVSGKTSFPMTSPSMSCEHAVACAFYPEGDRCKTHGGTTGSSYTLRTLPSVSEVTYCLADEDETCTQISPFTCLRSEIYPSCWYRLAPATRLFAQPQAFLVGTKYAPVESPATEVPTMIASDNYGSAATNSVSIHLVAVVLGGALLNTVLTLWG